MHDNGAKSVSNLALKWAKARSDILKLSVGTPAKIYREKLDALSNAEDELYQHCKQFVRLD